MTRFMGDATHDQVPALAGVPGLQLVAGYVTGTPDIQWTGADFARFPGLVHVFIDQGFTGSPVMSADVRDVEAGAWTPGAAVLLSGWTASRPTIYCNLSTLPAVLAAGWKGDLWLAIPGWQPGQPLPATPGCTVVAVQRTFTGTYDVSTVLDASWPLPAADPPVPNSAPAPPGRWLDATMTGRGLDGRLYVAYFDGSTGQWSTGPWPLP